MEVEKVMATDGEKIFEGLVEARKFFTQISLLLKTACDWLNKEGWKDDGVSNNTSQHILKPQQWMPYNIFRFFVADDKLNHICVTKELNARADKDVFMLNFL